MSVNRAENLVLKPFILIFFSCTKPKTPFVKVKILLLGVSTAKFSGVLSKNSFYNFLNTEICQIAQTGFQFFSVNVLAKKIPEQTCWRG